MVGLGSRILFQLEIFDRHFAGHNRPYLGKGIITMTKTQAAVLGLVLLVLTGMSFILWALISSWWFWIGLACIAGAFGLGYFLEEAHWFDDEDQTIVDWWYDKTSGWF